MIVQINPRTTGGRPSTKSAGLILTNLMRLLARNCSAVFALLKKCGLRKTRPFSTGCEREKQKSRFWLIKEATIDLSTPYQSFPG